MRTATTTNVASVRLSERALILEALQAFIAQRPGMDPRNYGDYAGYRKAVCAVMASALWDYWRSGHNANATPPHLEVANVVGNGSVAKAIRLSARKEFGLEIAKRYFDYRPGDYK